MLTFQPSLKTASGTVHTDGVRVSAETIGNVTVFCVHAHSTEEPLDKNAAVTIRINGTIDENDGYTAVHMYSDYWSKPYFSKNLSEVPDRTQGLIVKKTDGAYAVFLPIASAQYKCDLRGDTGGLTAVVFSWYDKLYACDAPAFCYAEGENPFALMAECAKAGMQVLGMGGKVRAERRYPEIFEYLGWCSWDAMQIRVCEDGLVRKCAEFKEKNIPVRWSILDDMWADIREFNGATYRDFGEMCRLMHSSTIYAFEADPIRFPNGLKHCIDEMKKTGMLVGMWHPTTGYWFGVNPDSPLFEETKELLVRTQDGRWIPSYEPGKAFLFYDKFHTFLQACGASFVKIDFQSNLRQLYQDFQPVGQTARTIQTAIEASVGAHFGGDIINCMGMASENMWNRQSSMISRCSDDFQPENRAWFTKHILQCAYNSVVQGQFFTCDWDMWWTDDGQAVKNSVLRAVSGGPIYVSDQLERSRREILMPLVLDDGRILRCDRPAMPAKECLTINPEESNRAFLVQNTCCNGEYGVIAAFNLHHGDIPVEGGISASIIEGLAEADAYAIYEYFTGAYTIVKNTDVYRFILENQDEFRLFIVTPVKDNIAILGILEKMIMPKTVSHIDRQHIENTEVFCHGTFGYIKDGSLYKIEK